MTSDKNAALRKKSLAVEQSIGALSAAHQALVKYAERTLSETKLALDEAQQRASLEGLNIPELRDALCTDMEAVNQPWVPSLIATLGSGPWEEKEFDYFLQDRGIEPVEAPAGSIDGLILGASGWDEEVLSQQIYDRDSRSLRVYTQELFVVGLILKKDPYDVLEQNAIDKVASQHPAIQFILDRDFIWPWTDVAQDEDGSESEGPPQDIDWAKESVLRLMGYSVRANGPSVDTRRAVLRQAFESAHLPGLRDGAHAKQWGKACSAQRLHTIAEFLRWLISFQGIDKPEARERWQSDLGWLKQRFYGPTMKFRWPVADEGEKRTPRPANAVFMMPLQPSPQLARIVGAQPQPRTEIVSRIWSYIKKYNAKINTISG